jgi:hypothetical protein
MLMTEIRKEPATGQVTDVGPALLTLAESAKSILGYDVLAKKMEKTTIATETTCLRMTLQSLGMEILNEQDVARYQKERLIERTTELMQEWMERTARVAMEDYHRGELDRFSGPGWSMIKIAEYKQPVPEFVLAKAVEVKEKMPECELYIEHLEDHPDPFLVVGAEKARYSWLKPEEHYYLVAWAEPKFEGRLWTGEAGTEKIDDIPF